jgi:hypothetical protein
VITPILLREDLKETYTLSSTRDYAVFKFTVNLTIDFDWDDEIVIRTDPIVGKYTTACDTDMSTLFTKPKFKPKKSNWAVKIKGNNN